ncbi:MAG: transglycosylase SLT domain-containing protein, partial [Pseudomonadales bacterium]
LLARYLSKRASAELKPYTRRLINVHRKPQRLSNHSDFTSNDPYSIDIISHGLKRLAAKDAELATRLWVDYRGFIVFSNHQYSDIRNKIARQIIASGNDNALDWLIVHDPNSEDSYLLEWRIRLAIKKQHWNQAQHWISILPDKLQQQPRWQYWLARTHQQSHDKQSNDKQALAMLEQLASERHYYGFLAADALNKDYDFNHSDLASTQLEQHIAAEPDIQRAHAFLTLGEFAPARREWLAAINRFDQQQLIAATNLAHHWGWHQQAIHTTIKAQQWNDLSIRFPLAFQTNMTDSAKSTTIRLEWLYAIARQESAFAQDAQSAAGARGLLQLKPRTAKQVARKMGIKYRSRDLLQADKNIVLGSHYLKQLLDDFEGNHILATAAYNAGPYRLKKWLKQQQTTLPYDIWIETLPFQETRNYVQNVLAFSVIYGHRLGLNSPLISQTELFIGK